MTFVNKRLFGPLRQPTIGISWPNDVITRKVWRLRLGAVFRTETSRTERDAQVLENLRDFDGMPIQTYPRHRPLGLVTDRLFDGEPQPDFNNVSRVGHQSSIYPALHHSHRDSLHHDQSVVHVADSDRVPRRVR